MRHAKAGVWLALGVVLAWFLVYLLRYDPASRFGQVHDDTIYFASAQALAEGQGYRVPSLPGSPPQTKYPILYPWLLSLIWKFYPSYPANVGAAVWISAAFSCWFLVAWFVALRRLPGLGDGPALVAVSLCAFQPFFLMLAGGLMTDIPFGALAVTSAILAHSACEPRGPTRLAIAAGGVAGLAVLMRSAGVAVVAGIVAFGLLRRNWRPVRGFLAGAVPVVALGRLAAGHPAMQAGFSAEGGGPGWQQTWLYYTSYFEFWKLSVADMRGLLAVMLENLQVFLQTVSTYCLLPPPAWLGPQLGPMLGVILTIGILSGIVRQARASGGRPIHAIFGCYLGLVLLWNYSYLMGRFLIPFLPLLYAGLWTEGRHLAAMLWHGLARSRPVPERVIAGALALAVAALGAGSLQHYLTGFRGSAGEQAALRAAANREKEELFDWVRRSTNPEARFISFDDAALYLATGRQGVWPIAFLPKGFFGGERAIVESDLARFHDAARHIGARYWVASEAGASISPASDVIIRRYREMQAVLPLLYETSRRNFQVYDLTCVQQPEQPVCRKAVTVLFPAGRGSQGPLRSAATVF